MLDLINQAMCSLQAALFGREVYSREHPAVSGHMESAHDHLTKALHKIEQVTILGFEDRVVFQNDKLPSSSTLADGLFRRLHQRGVEAVSFRRGLTRDEIGAMLDQLDDANKLPEKINGSAHIQFGWIGSTEPHGEADEAQSSKVAGNPRRQAGVLQHVWRDIRTGQPGQGELMTVVVDICAAVSVARGIMPPLASLKSHDEYTFVHTINVALLSTALAEEVGMRGDPLLDLTVAAVLHDIGKRMIPKSVLNKEGKLTDDEWKIIQRHPVDGARLLYGAPDIPAVAPIVAFEHHMYPDGGYPRVAGGWKMHLASRIVQVADVFDALRTDRPYRAGMSLQEALDILQKDAGTRYEHALLEAFVNRVAGNTQRELPEPARDIPRLRSA